MFTIKNRTLITKKYTIQFYRGLYGGFDFIPSFYWTKEYKDFVWGVWVLAIHNKDI